VSAKRWLILTLAGTLLLVGLVYFAFPPTSGDTSGTIVISDVSTATPAQQHVSPVATIVSPDVLPQTKEGLMGRIVEIGARTPTPSPNP